MFGVEDARKLVNSGTGNNKSDNDVFFLNTDLSKTDNTSVEINSLASSGNIRSLNNLPPLNQISYSDIQGTGIALNFQIATLNSTNDIIRYNGNGVSIKLLAQISGIYQPTTYAYHTGIGFLGSWYDYSYPQVPVYIRLMKNNTVLDTAYVLLSEQKPFSYSFNASINLVFGDYFYIDITPVDTTQPFLYNCFRATASANMTIQTNSAEIYGLKRGVYDAISGIDNGTTAYNIEDLTPKQMLLNHGDYIRSILWNYTQYSLTYLTTDKNHNLSITKNGATITECTDVPIGSLNPNLLFLPYYIKYKTKVPVNFKDILDNAANGHIQNSYIGINAYGYPMEVKQKPAIDESQEWKLLCSPKTSIDDILNIQFNAINTVQLMALGAYFSLLNSTKWYPWTLTKSDQYNFIHMDEDVQSEQTAHLLHPAQYIQKWQQNDTIRIQCITTNLAPVTIEIYNIETGLLAASFSLPQVTNQAVTSQYALFEGGYALTTLPEGIYQMKAIIGIGATQVMFKSEPMHVAEKWPNTMLFKYTDSRNKWTTIFTTGFAPEFRIEAKLGKFNTESRFSQFENQPADIETVNGIPYRTFILQIGWRSNGVPPWARELLEFILLLETCTVDGLRITRSNEAKFEEEEISGWPMSNWKIKVRQSINKFGVSQTTDGVINDQMLVTYPVNTLLFGDGNTDNTITVTDYQ